MLRPPELSMHQTFCFQTPPAGIVARFPSLFTGSQEYRRWAFRFLECAKDTKEAMGRKNVLREWRRMTIEFSLRGMGELHRNKRFIRKANKSSNGWISSFVIELTATAIEARSDIEIGSTRKIIMSRKLHFLSVENNNKARTLVHNECVYVCSREGKIFITPHRINTLPEK